MLPNKPVSSDAAKLAITAATAKAKDAQAAFIKFVLYCVCLALIAWNTSHENLLRASTTKLPLIDVGISLPTFYVLAPLVLLALHVWLLIYLSSLADNLMRVRDASADTRALDVNVESQAIRAQLDSFSLLIGALQGLADSPADKWYSRSLYAIDVLAIVLLPWSVFLLVQAQFIAYHSLEITSLHKLVLLADVTIVALLWRRLTGGDHTPLLLRGRRFLSLLLKSSLGSVLILAAIHRAVLAEILRLSQDMTILLVIASAVVLLVRALPAVVTIGVVASYSSTFILTFPNDPLAVFSKRTFYGRYYDAFAVKAKQETLQPASYLFPRTKHVARSIVLDQALLTRDSPTSEVAQKLRQAKDAKVEPAHLPEPLDLSGRDLRYATFRKAILPQVILRNAYLDAADFTEAYLVGAELPSEISSATFTMADLRYASFEVGAIQKALFFLANVDCSTIHDSKGAYAVLKDYIQYNPILLLNPALVAKEIEKPHLGFVESKDYEAHCPLLKRFARRDSFFR